MSRNSHDLALAHHRVWASTIWHAGYNASRRNKKPAHWALWAPDGKSWKNPDPAEEVSSLLRTKPHVFVTFADLDARVRKQDTQHRDVSTVTGWKRDRWGGWHLDPKGDDWPCEERVSSGTRWTDFSVCGRKRKDGDLCGVHANAARKRGERAVAERERSERSDAGHGIAEDAVKALAEINVGAGVHYKRPFGSGMGAYTGEVTVHGEDIIAMVRELQELREFREFA